jgi:hypothetical protein
MPLMPTGYRTVAVILGTALTCIAGHGMAQNAIPQTTHQLEQATGQMNAVEAPSGITAEWLKVPEVNISQFEAQHREPKGGGPRLCGAGHEVFWAIQLRRMSCAERRWGHGACIERRDLQVWRRAGKYLPHDFARPAAWNAGLGRIAARRSHLGSRQLHHEHQQSTEHRVGPDGIGAIPKHRAGPRRISGDRHSLAIHAAVQQRAEAG